MALHEFDENMRPDEEFEDGDLSYLVEGNKCRLLDGRRTAGYIETFFEESAMFRWRITKYEDKGKYWDLPAEKINSFQFEKDSKKLNQRKVDRIKKLIDKYNKEIHLIADSSKKEKTEREINNLKNDIKKWLDNNSQFLKREQTLDITSSRGPELLINDLNKYMKSVGLSEHEKKTAEIMVLNPNSGEWMKGMKIVLAEMGLVSYKGKVPRTGDIFKGLGSKEERKRYLAHRLAFIRAYFDLLNIKEVVLYRGMSTERGWIKSPRTFLSCTFSREVAEAFCNFERDSKYKNSYMLKLTCPVNDLFMTYLETEAMNRQYKEAEALVIYHEEICI